MTAFFSFSRAVTRPEGMWLILSRLGAAYYFLHFLVVLPLVGKYEQPRALPTSISQPILQTKHVSA